MPKPDHIPCERRQDFCGLLGSIQLISGKYLLIATTRELVGFLNGHAIWKLVDTKLIPYAKSTIHMNAQQIADNDRMYLVMELIPSRHRPAFVRLPVRVKSVFNAPVPEY